MRRVLMTSSGVVAMPVMDPASAPAQKHTSCCITSAEVATVANGQDWAFDVMHSSSVVLRLLQRPT